MTLRLDPIRLLSRILALVGALLVAAAISSVTLLISHHSPTEAFRLMYDYSLKPTSLVDILDKATPYYLAAIAVAIGFRMGLFNIGVDGQYRVAAMLSAALGGAAFLDWLPGALRMLLIVLAAMLVGAVWASVAGLLKVTRGVSEVISTIMLNAIGGNIVAYLLTTDRLAVQPEGSNNVSTRLLPPDAWVPDLPLIPNAPRGVHGFILVSVAVGIVYWYVLGRTRFGFDLRATGYNPSAAVASGVDAKRMVVATMVLSGAIAGLVGMPQLLGETHAYTPEFGGIGFTGIAIALLGRNSAVGIAFGALLWGFLDISSQILDFAEIPREIVTIMQGTTVLAVVVAYELADRLAKRAQQRRVGAVVAEPLPPPVLVGAATAGWPPGGPARPAGGPGGTRDGSGRDEVSP